MEYRFGLFCFFFLTAVGQMNYLYSFLQLNRSGMTSQHLNIFHVEFSHLFYTVDISHNCRGHHSVYRSRQLFFFHAFCLRCLKKTCSIKLNIHKRLTHLPANIFNSFLGQVFFFFFNLFQWLKFSQKFAWPYRLNSANKVIKCFSYWHFYHLTHMKHNFTCRQSVEPRLLILQKINRTICGAK